MVHGAYCIDIVISWFGNKIEGLIQSELVKMWFCDLDFKSNP